MFEYKTRTETMNGCKFYEQDVLLFNYSYSGDCIVEFVVDYNSPGFGLFLAKDSGGDISESEDVYIFKLGLDNEYQIINKQLLEQVSLRDEFIMPGVDMSIPAKDINLVFKIIDGCIIEAYVVNKINEELVETLLFEYEIPYVIENYKIGVYSNKGNVLKKSIIKSEAPNNWISNIFNSSGGRINWIKNGFEIENCEYDCEVESQNIKLEAGKYYFDFKCSNDDIKYYVYMSEIVSTEDKRPLETIISTKIDEQKNILDYKDNSFILEEDGFINIRFKGKEGVVEDIAIKRKKTDSFVETDYNDTVKKASYITINLKNINKIEISAEIMQFPLNDFGEEDDYSIFESENKILDKHDFSYNDYANKTDYVVDVKNGTVSINGIESEKLRKELLSMGDLIIFKNIDAAVHKFTVINNNEEEVDILQNKSFKIAISKDIKTPIIISDEDGNPFDISSSYREVVDKNKAMDIFNRYNIIKLKHRLCLNDADVIVAGINSQIDTNKKSVKDMDGAEIISTTKYMINWQNNSISLDEDVKNRYKYIMVEYYHCDDYFYEFTNFEREIFDLNETQNIFLSKVMCDAPGSSIVYAIPKDAVFYKDMVYRVPNQKAINSIDYCATSYDILTENSLKVSQSGSIIVKDGIREKYDYLIIDYMKNDSYCVNERNGYYEIDVATNNDIVKSLYDSTEDGVVNTYRKLNIDDIVEDNFIVLRKD